MEVSAARAGEAGAARGGKSAEEGAAAARGAASFARRWFSPRCCGALGSLSARARLALLLALLVALALLSATCREPVARMVRMQMPVAEWWSAPFGLPWSRAYAVWPSALLGHEYRSPGVTLMSSRELARACCDYAPLAFLSVYFEHESWREHGLVDFGAALRRFLDHDRARLAPGRAVTVFVPSAMIREFLRDFFLALPAGVEAVVVSGLDDCGPAELFGHGRALCDARPPLALAAFLGDARLRHWLVQNWDLDGALCATTPAVGEERCSAPQLPASALAKVSPLPIGLDLHTLAEKLSQRSGAEQEQQLRALARRVRWPDKPLLALAVFTIDRPWRVELARALAAHSECVVTAGDARPTSGVSARDAYWEQHAGAAFALAPQGQGIDTHRVYEALNLRTVPIVSSSPLDALYAQLPVIVLRNWSGFSCAGLAAMRSDVQRRFGEDPFANEMVQRSLSLALWARRVKALAEPAARTPAASSLAATAAAAAAEALPSAAVAAAPSAAAPAPAPAASSSAAITAAEAATEAHPADDSADRVIITAITRDDWEGLEANTAQVEWLGAQFRDYRVIVVENDSSRLFRARLAKWAARNPRVRIISRDVGLRKRPSLRFLAHMRNLYVAEMASTEYDGFGRVIVFDMDLTDRWPAVAIGTVAKNHALQGAHCVHVYHPGGGHRDALALRSATLFPFYKLVDAANVDQDALHALYERTAALAKQGGVVHVESCFGGMAVYSRDVFRKCRYDEEAELCEHLALNRCIRDHGWTLALDFSMQMSFHDVRYPFRHRFFVD